MRLIIYAGNDAEFFSELEAFARFRGGVECVCLSSGAEIVVKEILHRKPQLVITDATQTPEFVGALRALRQIEFFRALVLAVYCKDQSEVSSAEDFLSFGAILFHVKETDSETFFRDVFHMTFEGNFLNPDFARAKNLGITLDVGFLGNIAAVSSGHVLIETDLPPGRELTVCLPMATGPALSLPVQDTTSPALTAHFLNSAVTEIPYPGPWDTISEDSLCPDTVETWLGFKEEAFDPRSAVVFMFTEDPEFLGELLLRPAKSWYRIFSRFDPFVDAVRGLSPELIIFDLQSNEGPDLSHLESVIEEIREQKPSPIVVALRSPSESAALRKLYLYDLVLSSPEKLTTALFESLVSKALERNRGSRKWNYLLPGDSDRRCWVEKTIRLTSLSERDFTFVTDLEIPYFSVLRTQLPFPGYLTVVPAEGSLPPSREGNHYRALLHGISEEELSKLRKVVNQLIYTPRKELSREIVEAMLKQDLRPAAVKVPEASEAPKAPAGEIFLAPVSSPHAHYAVRNFRGKSKL